MASPAAGQPAWLWLAYPAAPATSQSALLSPTFLPFPEQGFEKTGLGERVATLFVKLFGKSTLGLAYGLSVAETVIAPAMPSTTARAGGIFMPIINSLSLSAGSKPSACPAGCPRRSQPLLALPGPCPPAAAAGLSLQRPLLQPLHRVTLTHFHRLSLPPKPPCRRPLPKEAGRLPGAVPAAGVGQQLRDVPHRRRAEPAVHEDCQRDGRAGGQPMGHLVQGAEAVPAAAGLAAALPACLPACLGLRSGATIAGHCCCTVACLPTPPTAPPNTPRTLAALPPCLQASVVPAAVGLAITPLLMYTLFPPEIKDTPEAPKVGE